MNKEITIGELNEIYQKYGDLGFKVETPYGYKDIEWCGITEENADVYRCELENGMFVEGADYHRLKRTDDEFVVLKEIKVGELVQTKNGDSAVTNIELLEEKDTLYDIQVAEVHQYYTNGIVSHNTTLTIDAIKFLLHGSTTKTDKNEEVFNSYSEKNELTVRGMLEIDNEEFIIERKMKRTAKKGGGWTILNKVNFYKTLPDGEEEELNDEDAKKTTLKLRESIGSEKDFELLVLATEKNLDDLIGLTTTESGKVLNRLIGLEVLELKETIVRGMYNEFNKKKKSNEYDIVTLTQDIEEHNEAITRNDSTKKTLENRLSEVKDTLIKYKEENDRLINSKEKIDVSITTLNPSALQDDIDTLTIKGISLKEKINELQAQIDALGQIEFDEDAHYALTKEYNKIMAEKAIKDAEIKKLKIEIDKLIDSGICHACNRKLDDVDNEAHINKHKENLTALSKEIDGLIKVANEVNSELTKLTNIKLSVDTKNKLELDRDRLEVEVGSLRNNVGAKLNDLKKYKLNLDAIEHNKNIDIKVSKVKTDIAVLEHSKDEIITKLERITIDIKVLNEDILRKFKLIETIKKEDEVEKIFKVYIELVGKKGISKLVLRSVLPIINSELHRLLDEVCDFNVEIFIDDKNDVQFLINKDNVVKPLKSGSGFEKTAASLALRAILGKVSTLPMPNFITFDEVLGKISAENLDKIKLLFDKIKEMYEIVFLITHNDIVKDWADNIITINKKDNISAFSMK